MGDMAEVFNAMRDASKDKRARNREWSTKRLADLGIPFEEKNLGAHLIVMGRIDFWPGTGKWIDRKAPSKRTRGIDSLLNYIRTVSSEDKGL